MSDPKAPSEAGQTNEMLRSFQNQYPAYMKLLNSQLGPSAQANYSANAAIAPQQQQLTASLYAAFAPLLNQIGQGISNSNQLNQTANNAATVNSQGANSLLGGLQNLQSQLDPQFYGLRNQIGQGESNILSSLGNPNKLSGSEQATIERGINRQNNNGGNLTNGSPLNTVQNAMTFGQGLQNRQQFQSGMFGQAASMAPSLKGDVNAQNAIIGQPYNTSFGSSQLTGGAQPGNVTQPADWLNTLFGGATSLANNNANINANRRDVVDRINGTISSLPSY